MKKESNPLLRDFIKPPPPPAPPSRNVKGVVSRPKKETGMIKSKINKCVVVTLTLEEKEARWLKGLVQNPIGVSPDDESEENEKIRRCFWEALSEIEL